MQVMQTAAGFGFEKSMMKFGKWKARPSCTGVYAGIASLLEQSARTVLQCGQYTKSALVTVARAARHMRKSGPNQPDSRTEMG